MLFHVTVLIENPERPLGNRGVPRLFRFRALDPKAGLGLLKRFRDIQLTGRFVNVGPFDSPRRHPVAEAITNKG